MPNFFFISCFQRIVHVSGTARAGRYYVIVHFYQPNFLSFLGKVIVSGQSTSALMNFRYCPYVSGCRTIGTSQHREGMSQSVYIGRQNSIIVSINIPEDKSIWIVSIVERSFMTFEFPSSSRSSKNPGHNCTRIFNLNEIC